MNDDDKKAKIERRVRKIRNFYTNLFTYIAVNLLLLLINLVTSPHSLWFYWVSIIWGFAILVQAFNTFTLKDQFLGEEWEERKIKELMDKEKNRKSDHD